MPQPNAVYLAKALNGTKEGRDWRCECPVHDNGTHLIITDKRGHLQMNCMMGAKHDELVAALQARGLWDLPSGNSPILRTAHSNSGRAIKPSGTVSPEPVASPQPTTLQPVWVEDYTYRNVDGDIIAIKGRFVAGDKKTFLWKLPGSDKWGGLNGIGPELPLYGVELLPLTPDVEVWFVEGEKAANSCRDHDLIAVCGYAGASVLPEKALKALTGRRVIIWPDNDTQGRAFALQVKTALNGIANVGLVIQPQGEEKADAWDYFAAGGTVEELRSAGGLPEGPTIRFADNAYWVETLDGVRFCFENVTHGKHAIDADVTVWHDAPGITPDEFSGRVNLLSLSNVKEYRYGLQDMFDRPKGYWSGVIGKALSLVKREIADYDPSINIKDAPDVVDNGYIVHPLLLAQGPTIWFGDGGTGKSYQALALSKAVCEAGKYLNLQCAWREVLYLDYETDSATVKDRLRRLGGYPDEGFHYMNARGRPLVDWLPALKRKIRKNMIGLIVVDSAVPACGGKPEDTDSAAGYFAALSQLGIASLTISHVTKAGEDHYPLGSVMWNNLGRMTWNVKSQQEEGESVTHLGLYNRKINDDRRHRPIGLRLVFGATGVSISREEITADDLVQHLSLPQRLRKMLARGENSVKVLADEAGSTESKVRLALSRMTDATRLGRAPDGSYFWGLRANAT